MASFYYKNIRDFETPTKDFFLAVQQNEKFNISKFDAHVYAYAKGLLDGFGVKKGTKIALWMTDELENVVMQYACALAGATAVVIDPTLDVNAVQSIVADEEVRLLWVSPRYGQQVRHTQIKEAFAQELEEYEYEWGYFPINSKRFRSLKFIVSTGTESTEGIVRMKDTPVYGLAGVYDTDEIAAIQYYLAPSDAVAIHYAASNGSAAPVKTAAKPLNHTDLIKAAEAAAAKLGLTSADTVTVAAPLHYPATFAAGVMAAASKQARTVLPSKLFDASKTLAAMTQQASTAIVATTEQVAALQAALDADAAKPQGKRDFDISRLRTGFVMGKEAATLGNAKLNPIADPYKLA